MELKIINKDGQETGKTVELSKDIFEIEPNDHAIYMDVKSITANSHQGTHKTKTRTEVRGGGAKPFRQKGTGNARRGSSRSPVMVGGGKIHGPQPHDYTSKINKKVKKLARKSALSYKAKDQQIVVLEDFELNEIKTKNVATMLKSLGLDQVKTLMLTPVKNENILKSGRNIQKLNILEANKASTFNILNCKTLVIQESAVKVLEESITGA